MESICEELAFERQYQIPAAAMAMNKPTSRTGTTIFQSFPRPAAEGSATFTALNDGDEASAGEEPEAGDGGWATRDPLSCAVITVPEPAGTPCRDSVSRFSRFRSARISEAT